MRTVLRGTSGYLVAISCKMQVRDYILETDIFKQYGRHLIQITTSFVKFQKEEISPINEKEALSASPIKWLHNFFT